MRKNLTYTPTDATLRIALYRFIVARGHVPKIRELAAALSRPEKIIRAGIRRLAQLHIVVLQPHSSEILRAAPFWAVPTTFHVQSGERSWWASCIWDARNSRNAPPRRRHHYRVRLLRLRHAAHRSQWPSDLSERRHPFRRSRFSLVRKYRLHLKDYAALPVGRARCALVPHLESSPWRGLLAPSGPASRQGLVWQPPFSLLAPLFTRPSASRSLQRRPALQFLAIAKIMTTTPTNLPRHIQKVCVFL